MRTAAPAFLNLALIPSVGIVLVAGADMAVQWATRKVFRRRVVILEILSLFLLLGLGGFWVARETGVHLRTLGELSTSPQLLTAAAFCLYFSQVMIYFQFKSIFSRGYSLRILVDLSHAGRQETLSHLKSAYGQGMGLSGMISKRLRSLAAGGLLHFDGNALGSLTWLGRIIAMISERSRRWVRMEDVG